MQIIFSRQSSFFFLSLQSSTLFVVQRICEKMRNSTRLNMSWKNSKKMCHFFPLSYLLSKGEAKVSKSKLRRLIPMVDNNGFSDPVATCSFTNTTISRKIVDNFIDWEQFFYFLLKPVHQECMYLPAEPIKAFTQ